MQDGKKNTAIEDVKELTRTTIRTDRIMVIRTMIMETTETMKMAVVIKIF
jgi:hypothetical protein